MVGLMESKVVHFVIYYTRKWRQKVRKRIHGFRKPRINFMENFFKCLTLSLLAFFSNASRRKKIFQIHQLEKIEY